jgi:hypothetical protein
MGRGFAHGWGGEFRHDWVLEKKDNKPNDILEHYPIETKIPKHGGYIYETWLAQEDGYVIFKEPF